MPFSSSRLIRRAIVPVALACIVAGCTKDGGRDAEAPWVELYRTPEAVARVDTSRLTTSGATDDVWIRLDFAQPQAFPDDPSRTFSRIDLHTRLTCAAQGVDDIGLELRDSTGALLEEAPGTRWKSFDEHPFGEAAFPALCQRLPALRRERR
jgi:hypothetical protein